MSQALPTIPYPLSATPRLIDFGGDVTPPLGGVAQRFSRLGSRWSVDLVFPTMSLPLAGPFLAALFKARANGATLLASFPQPAFTASLGTPLVNGASQTGTSLVIDGLTPSITTLVAGTFFSLVVGSRNYLYVLTDTASVNGSGQTTLSIAPMLRASPADNAALHFATPQIEGFAQGQSESWTLDRLAWFTTKLTIQEVA